jgi:YbbR domain-containing protein
MPLSELDDVQAGRRARVPRGIEVWLYKIFLRNLGLKLLALAITLGLWFAVVGQRASTTIRLRNVPLNFRLPAEMEISNEPRDEIEVTLAGSRRALDRVNIRDLSAYVDAYYTPGERVVPLTPKKLSMDLPEGVTIEDVKPNTVSLRLEPRIEREVKVEARLEGQVPEGYELRHVAIRPETVRLRGPQSHVEAIASAPTESILLDEHTENFSVPQAAINIADQKVTVLNPTVNVYIEIGEVRIEKTFTNVSVREQTGTHHVQPLKASVTLYGARSVLDKLRAEDVNITLEVAANGAITPHVELPTDIKDQVESRSIKLLNFSRKQN